MKTLFLQAADKFLTSNAAFLHAWNGFLCQCSQKGEGPLILQAISPQLKETLLVEVSIGQQGVMVVVAVTSSSQWATQLRDGQAHWPQTDRLSVPIVM